MFRSILYILLILGAFSACSGGGCNPVGPKADPTATPAPSGPTPTPTNTPVWTLLQSFDSGTGTWNGTGFTLSQANSQPGVVGTYYGNFNTGPATAGGVNWITFNALSTTALDINFRFSTFQYTSVNNNVNQVAVLFGWGSQVLGGISYNPFNQFPGIASGNGMLFQAGPAGFAGAGFNNVLIHWNGSSSVYYFNGNGGGGAWSANCSIALPAGISPTPSQGWLAVMRWSAFDQTEDIALDEIRMGQ
jgi:hypothetical protein